ncbi:MAG: hypothetical protein ACRERC_20685, partial [Candidatus Binatia bacterium]
GCQIAGPAAAAAAVARDRLRRAVRALQQLRLWRHGGVGLLDGWLRADLPGRLLVEARGALAGATRSDVRVSDGEEWRGGEPARRFHSAPGAALQGALYHDEALLRALRSCVGTPLRPSGSCGTFSYYAHAGDFLALHRDVAECDVAVITCLYDSAPAGTGGGTLVVYPERAAEPLSAVRAAPHRGAAGVRLVPGQSVVLLGGLVPHAVTPIAPAQQRVISALCYQFAPPGR